MLGVAFEPDDDDWYFRSINVSGDRKWAGPSVTSSSGQQIDFTWTCPTSESPHHLDIDSTGGSWTVYLIGLTE